MTLTCHVTKEWSNIMGGSPPWQVTSLPSLVAIDTVAVENYFRLSRDLTITPIRRVM